MPMELVAREQWLRMSTAERIQHLLDMTLDEVRDILAAPYKWVDPDNGRVYTNAPLLNAKIQCHKVIMNSAVKVATEAARERSRADTLDRLAEAIAQSRE